MSATTPTDTTPSVEVVTHRAGYGRAVRSEWIKARTLRSTWILVGFALLAFIGLPVLVTGETTVTDPAEGAVAAMHAIFTASDFVLILVAVLGALLTTSEFTTGMARNTFTATPKRGAVLAAKATIASLFALGIAVVGAVATWFALGDKLSGAASLDFGNAEMVKVLVVSLIGYVVTAVLAASLGVLLRSSVGTIFTIVAMQLILPGILLSVPSDIANWCGAILPGVAASAAVNTDPIDPGTIFLTPGAGLAVLIAWAVLPFLAAMAVLRTRDV
ncbi:ABC transporter permease [Demequina gelatinilytica]|uniref:ABC transporter permease n=1 Tax=Demequina gelatinilytica TaxID=1638980 RepID=UPI000783E58B|nr:ABC transporter permease [Demequina gelatinilytica]